jgi:hypothetical protein
VYTGLPTGQGVYFAVAMGSSGGRVKILSASFPMGGAPSAAASVFTVSGCGMAEFNGVYAVDTAKDGGVRNGKPCYRKNAAGSAGGKQTVNFSSGSWYMCEDHSGSWYKVSSSADLPPASGWSTGSNGTGSPPHLMFSAAGSVQSSGQSGQPTCGNGHQLVRNLEDNGWACDGRHLPGGCKRGCTGFRQSAGWGRYRCATCDYDLCDRCYEARSTHNTPALAQSSTKSCFAVSGCGMAEFNGVYAVDTAKDGGVRNGKPCYRKSAAGSAGAEQTVNFSSGKWYMCKNHSGAWYSVSSSADLPPSSGWWRSSNGSGSPPQLEFDMHWDMGSKDTAGTATLRAHDTVIEKTASGGSGYCAFVCQHPFPSTGTHTVDVKIDSRNTEMAVGVVKSWAHLQSHEFGSKGWIGNGDHGWGVFNDGDGCHSGSWASRSPGYSSGDTVQIIYNADARIFGWAIKGTTHSSVYSGVTGPLYLAVSMGSSGACKATITASSFPMCGRSLVAAVPAPSAPAPSAPAPAGPMLTAVGACTGWAIDCIAFKDSDGSIRKNESAESGAKTAASISSWTTLNSPVVRVSGLNGPGYVAHTVTLHLSSGHKATFAGGNEGWKKDSFSFDVPRGHRLLQLQGSNGRITGIETVAIRPATVAAVDEGIPPPRQVKGWLSKKIGVGSGKWKRLWFELSAAGDLEFFEDEGGDCEGELPLDGASVRMSECATAEPGEFELVHISSTRHE